MTIKILPFKTTSFLPFLVILLFSAIISQNAESSTTVSNSGGYFIENKGQWSAGTKFVSSAPNLNVVITNGGLLYDYGVSTRIAGDNGLQVKKSGQVISFNFLNSAFNNITGEEIDDAPYFNFFIGNDQSKWASGCKAYKNIRINEIYKGISAVVHFDGNEPRYDFIISPGADPSQINFKIDGISKSYLSEKGDIILGTRFGDFSHTGIFAFQGDKDNANPVNCRFVKNGDSYRFELGNYDKSRPLVIDPIVFSTYLGGSFEDSITGINSSVYGQFVVCGSTSSSDFKTTPGAYDTVYNYLRDAFVSKMYLYESKNKLIFSTIIGTGSDDYATSVSTDPENNIYITGETNSNEFPTFSPIYKDYVGGYDIFVTKFDSLGRKLIYSTYLGGKKDDFATKIVCGSDNAAYICGYTTSTDYPTIGGAFQSKIKGLTDIIVSKISATGKTLAFSTYIGGASDDRAFGMAIDIDQTLFITGETSSGDFPYSPYQTWGPNVIQQPYDYSYNGGLDCFVLHLIGDGGKLDYATYFGGTADDRGTDVVPDADGSCFVFGETYVESSKVKFPTTTSAYQKTHNGRWDCFFAKLSKVNSTSQFGQTYKTQNLIFSTYLGGSGDDRSNEMIVDNSTHSLYMVGRTNSSNYPLIGTSVTKLLGKGDIFLTKFSGAGDAVVLSTLLGGKDEDYPAGVAIDSRYDVYVAGASASKDIVTTNSQIQTNYGGGSMDGVIFKFAFGDLKLLNPIGGEEICPNSNFDIKWMATDFSSSDSFKVEVSENFDSSSTVLSSKVSGSKFTWVVPDHFKSGTNYFARVSNKSGIFVTSPKPFTILEQPAIANVTASTTDTTLCEGDSITFNVSASGSYLKYQWYLDDNQITGATSSTYTAKNLTKNGSYYVNVKGNCTPEANSKAINIYIQPSTAVLVPAKDTLIRKGKDISFKVISKGINKSFAWFKDGWKILSATDSVYSINGANISHQGNYKCIVTGDCGVDSSFAFRLSVDTTTAVNDNNNSIGQDLFFETNSQLTGGITELNLISSRDRDVIVRLFSNNGNLMNEVFKGFVLSGDNELKIDLSDYPDGVYWIVAESQGFRAETKVLLFK